MKSFGILLPRMGVCLSITAVGVALAACSGAGSPARTSTAIPAIQPTPTVEALVEPQSSANEVFTLGAELYAANCQVCHGDSNGIGGTGGAPPHNKAGHTWHHPDAQLREWVLNGKLGFGSPGMPALGDKLAEPEVDAILTFIKTWWTAEQRSSQADISQRYHEALEKQSGQ